MAQPTAEKRLATLYLADLIARPDQVFREVQKRLKEQGEREIPLAEIEALALERSRHYVALLTADEIVSLTEINSACIIALTLGDETKLRAWLSKFLPPELVERRIRKTKDNIKFRGNQWSPGTRRF